MADSPAAASGPRLENRDPPPTELFRVGAMAALLMSLLIPIALAVFAAWPPPLEGDAEEWFEVFDRSPVLGLLSMDLLLIVVLVLEIPLLLAVYAALRGSNQWLMAIATVVGLVGITVHVATNPAVEMLTLSEHHRAATTDAERAVFVSAGEAALARYEGTGFHFNYLLGGTLVPLVVSTVMLRGKNFGRGVAYTGLMAAVINLGLYVPEVGLYLSVAAGLATWVWYILLSRGLFALART